LPWVAGIYDFLFIIAWLLIGCAIGGLGHLLVPGRRRIGALAAMIFGMAGSLLGSIITVTIRRIT